eukprot:CAMPEP_0171159886 /NCGR_PEP_ID=MMETSP0790-20130122/3272_1 /TAXON_ID=2925 /ORGANISM="Alexandrium catenella, Strain OF101" /LENGTH=53 /DNA_ID=CAMNT_0011624401 /DNA_START=1173 /DNA_END=1331 /DNA_ORIENTATION=-
MLLKASVWHNKARPTPICGWRVTSPPWSRTRRPRGMAKSKINEAAAHCGTGRD